MSTHSTILTSEAVRRLDAIDPSDPEDAHGQADLVLLASVPESVRDAYLRLVARTDWWVTA